MLFDVKLYVGGKLFVESVHAVNRNEAIDTAKIEIHTPKLWVLILI